MKKVLITFLVLLTAVSAGAQKVIYKPADSQKIETLLNKAKDKKLGYNAMVYFSRCFKGIPYVAHTLETPGEECLVVNTRQLDCLTLVETTLALSICHNTGRTTFDDYCEVLRSLRYRGGHTDTYASRIHYFTEWAADNAKMGFVKDALNEDSPETTEGVADVWFMSRHPESYSKLVEQPYLVEQIAAWEREISGQHFRYIPKDKLKPSAALRQNVHNGDVIGIVTSKKGLDIAHVGIAVWHKDGLHLINASSIHHKVVEEPMTLYRYMQKHPSQKGIRVIRPVF